MNETIKELDIPEHIADEIVAVDVATDAVEQAIVQAEASQSGVPSPPGDSYSDTYGDEPQRPPWLNEDFIAQVDRITATSEIEPLIEVSEHVHLIEVRPAVANPVGSGRAAFSIVVYESDVIEFDGKVEKGVPDAIKATLQQMLSDYIDRAIDDGEDQAVQ